MQIAEENRLKVQAQAPKQKLKACNCQVHEEKGNYSTRCYFFSFQVNFGKPTFFAEPM
jgi:hypothetical protein